MGDHMKRLLITAAGMALLGATGANALSLTPSTDAATMAAALLGGTPGISIVAGSETYQGGATQGGTYTGFSVSNSTKTIAVGDGVVLTSGDINDIPGNDGSAFTSIPNVGSDADLQTLVPQTVTNDANVLTFDFTADPGITSISLDFVFGSDEYPDQSVTDIFGVFVDGVNYAFFSDGSVINFALGSIASTFFNDNDFGSADPFVDSSGTALEYDGIVDALTVVGILDPSKSTHTMKIAIGDTSDQAYDSGVFVSGLVGGTSTGGGGINPDPDPDAYIPVPAGLPLLLGGLGAMALVRRRKRAA